MVIVENDHDIPIIKLSERDDHVRRFFLPSNRLLKELKGDGAMKILLISTGER